jgi:peptide/nickel transport system substrate-binding protein
MQHFTSAFVALFTVLAASGAWPAWAGPEHGIAMHGKTLYPAGFTSFAYVEPGAPKGGHLSLSVQGTFDSLKPFIIKGAAAAGLRGFVYESLLERSLDEPFSLYGLIAQSIEVPEDRGSATFVLRPEAQFSDGHPITPEDVIFSLEVLREHGRPNTQTYYKKVERMERVGERGVRFLFKGGDREMPLIIGLMPILPKHAIDVARFEETSLAIPVGSGPYVVAEVDAGRSITYRRNAEYWGRDLAVMRGRFNFDTVSYTYGRDAGSLFESFKSGEVHVAEEGDPARWIAAYDFPPANDGRVVKKEFPLGTPAGMSALVLNLRRPALADRRVRQALVLLFDFESLNRSLYHGVYSRTASFFERSGLSAAGRPADAAERALLAPFAGEVSPEVMEGTFRLPSSDGNGTNRDNRIEAVRLLKEAGYDYRGGALVDARSGRPLTLEVLTVSRDQERLIVAYSAMLRSVGIGLTIRHLDGVLYKTRLDAFDFDLIQFHWPASLSPGNEQLFRWSTEKAATKGSWNYPGVTSKAADAMIDAMLKAGDRPAFEAAVRALDRVLMSGDYVIPLFHLKTQRVAHWRHLRHPERTSLYGYQLDTWWADPGTPGP